MSEKIVDIASRQPHKVGRAFCEGCGYDWLAVAPVSTSLLECKNCGMMLGRYRTLFKREELEGWIKRNERHMTQMNGLEVIVVFSGDLLNFINEIYKDENDN